MTLGNVLVTGGAGFIGSHLVEALIGDGYRVRVIDNFSTGIMTNLQSALHSERLEIVEGSVTNPKSVRRAVRGVHTIFHEAAIASVQRSFRYPRSTIHTNLNGTKILLGAAKDEGVKTFVLASSAAVYGNSGKMPISEIARPRPMSPYARSKLLAERVCLDMGSNFGLAVVVLRYFNVYGSRMPVKNGGVLAKIVARLTEKRRPVVYGSGEQTRDFVHVSDVVAASILAARSPAAAGKVYNVGSGIGTSIIALIRLTNSILNGSQSIVNIDFKPPKKGDPKDSFADISKINQELGFVPRVAVQDGVRDYITWFTSRKEVKEVTASAWRERYKNGMKRRSA